MSITYVSRYHCPEDPGGLVRETLNLGDDFPGPAHDVLLSWSLRLDEGLAPHVAARRLLKRYDLLREPLPSGACGELVRLLQQAAKEPTERPARRRGGRDGRRN